MKKIIGVTQYGQNLSLSIIISAFISGLFTKQKSENEASKTSVKRPLVRFFLFGMKSDSTNLKKNSTYKESKISNYSVTNLTTDFSKLHLNYWGQKILLGVKFWARNEILG